MTDETPDMVNHPPHYTSHPSGHECIEITEHYGFSIGNAIKYLWRAGLKHDAIEDLHKAVWYIEREIAKREKERKERVKNHVSFTVTMPNASLETIGLATGGIIPPHDQTPLRFTAKAQAPVEDDEE